MLKISHWFIKIMLITFCLVSGLGLFSAIVLGIDVYGDFSSYFSHDDMNAGSLTANPSNHNDMKDMIGGNLYFRGTDDNQFQYLLNLKLNGSYSNSIPIALSVGQMYILVPFSDKLFVYGGQKIKEIGVSNFFNISNRISPKFLSNYSYTRNAPGLIECDFIQSDALAYGLMFNFQDGKNWNEVQSSLFFNTRLNNFNMEGYWYYDESKDSFLGLDLTYQIGIYQLYIESILKKKAEQQVLSGDETKPFETRDMENAAGVVLGGSVSIDKFIGSLEYYYSNEGYNSAEQKDFFDYFNNFTGTLAQKQGLLYSSYTRCAFLKNYLGLSLSQSSFIKKELSMGLSAVASFQPESNSSQYASCEFTFNLSYILHQNLIATFYQTYRTGGAQGEFNKLNTDISSSALAITYSF